MNILSSVGSKIGIPTVMSYIGYCEDAWLLLRLRNIASAFSEKESNCKYYLIDNGIQNLLLLESEILLFEHLVTLQLFRRYGNDREVETLWELPNFKERKKRLIVTKEDEDDLSQIDFLCHPHFSFIVCQKVFGVNFLRTAQRPF